MEATKGFKGSIKILGSGSVSQQFRPALVCMYKRKIKVFLETTRLSTGLKTTEDVTGATVALKGFRIVIKCPNFVFREIHFQIKCRTSCERFLAIAQRLLTSTDAGQESKAEVGQQGQLLSKKAFERGPSRPSPYMPRSVLTESRMKENQMDMCTEIVVGRGQNRTLEWGLPSPATTIIPVWDDSKENFDRYNSSQPSVRSLCAMGWMELNLEGNSMESERRPLASITKKPAQTLWAQAQQRTQNMTGQTLLTTGLKIGTSCGNRIASQTVGFNRHKRSMGSGRKTLASLTKKSVPTGQPSGLLKKRNIAAQTAMKIGQTTDMNGVKLQTLGFINLGNSCYLSALLQVFYELVPFLENLQKFSEAFKEFLTYDSLTLSLHRLFMIKQHPEQYRMNDLIERLEAVKRAVGNADRSFDNYKQQDADELFHLLLNSINAEYTNLGCNSNTGPVSSNFESVVVTTITCRQCQVRTRRSEMLLNFPLSVPQDNDRGAGVQHSVQDSLDSYFQTEKIDYVCETCWCTQAERRATFQKPPRILTLLLKRHSLENQEVIKNDAKVILPRYITLQQFCDSAESTLLNCDKDRKASTSAVDCASSTKMVTDIARTGTEGMESASSEGAETPFPYAQEFDDRGADRMDTSGSDDNDLTQLPFSEQLRLAKMRSLADSQPASQGTSEGSASVSQMKTSPAGNSVAEAFSEETSPAETFPQECQSQVLSRGSDPNSPVTSHMHVKDFGFGGEKSVSLQNDSAALQSGQYLSSGYISIDTDFLNTRQNEVPEGMSNDYAECPESSVMDCNEDKGDGSDHVVQRISGEPLSQKVFRMALDPRLMSGQEQSHAGAWISDELSQRCAAEIKRRRDRLADIQKGTHPKTYQLVGIINHLGSTQAQGHYVSDVLQIKEGRWLSFNDESVIACTEEHLLGVRERVGYILFYMDKEEVESIRRRKGP